MAAKKKGENATKVDWERYVKPLDWVEQRGDDFIFRGEDQEEALAFLASRFILTLDAENRLRAFLAGEIAKRDDLPEILAKRESGY
jgi:hypothetical protein